MRDGSIVVEAEVANEEDGPERPGYTREPACLRLEEDVRVDRIIFEAFHRALVELQRRVLLLCSAIRTEGDDTGG